MENNTKLNIATKPGEPVILQSAAETPRHPYLAELYAYKRRLTREVMVGKVGVGGTNPIRVQSMTTTRTQDVEATLAQTLRLVEAGCEIVRIINRFGDTPEGMVESAIEFAAICRKYDYHDLIFSMKASNPKVMIAAYRLLVARLDALGWNYPLHLGVTEAGNAEDGRIKSAAGIGSLLDDGLGDTVRVSLTEEPEEEVPVAFALVKPYNAVASGEWRVASATSDTSHSPLTTSHSSLPDLRDPYHYVPRPTYEVASGAVKVGGMQPVAVVASVGLFVDAFEAVAGL